MQRPGLLMRSASLIAGMAAIGSCSKDALGPDAAGVESVVVAPATATVAVGANLTLNAEVLDASGNVLPSPHVSWASADPSIADVSPVGVVTGRKVGTVLIAASSRGKDAFARITVNPTPVASVRLSSTHASLLLGQTVQLVAQLLDASGGVLTGRPVTWLSSDPQVATVTSSGMVTALGAGAAIVTASSEGKSAVATVTVSLVPVATITLTPTTSNVVVGQTTQLSARLRDAAGNTITGRMVTWSTNRATVATVTSDGLVTAIGTGTATITASSEGKTASATVNVSPRPAATVIVSPGQVTIFANQTVQLTALVTDDRGQVLTGSPIAFSTSNSQVASVSSSGLVTGISAGTATISVTSEGIIGTATVTVAPDPVAVVEVTPSSTSIIVGSTVQLVATPRNASGQPLTGRTVTWSSGSPALASVSSSGVATGLAVGNAVIIATVEGKQGSAMVTVRLVPVATVSVTPATATTTIGQTVAFAATPLDASGNRLSGRIAGWSSSDNAVATVSSSGVVTGVSAGNAVITATIEGVSGSATVSVSPPAAASVTVSPATATVVAGQSVTLGATARDAGGNTIATASFTWTSANPAIATVSTSGVVTGAAAGSTTISATSGSATGTATITVTAVPVATVTVSPSSSTTVVGQSVTLSATTRDANGNVLTGRTITWSSSAPSIASVSAAGVVTGVSPGSATITATSEGKSGTAAVTVTNPPISTIVVTPANPRVKVGQTVQLTATAYDASNNVITGVTFTWTSSNTGRATVNGSGLVTTIRDGNVTITASAGGKSGSTTVRIDP